MCFGNKQTGSQTTKLPAYMEAAGQQAVGAGTALLEKPFEAYGGERVAPFAGDQTSAFQRLRDLIAGAPNVGPEALDMVRGGATAPAQQVGTERTVDEGGRLGAIADYMNPYVDAAIQPAIDRISEQAAQQRKRIGAGATAAGAYGDARHGIMESELDRNTSRAIGDTAAGAYKSAFDTVMGQRSGDLGRFMQSDIAGGQFGEQALQRLLGGASGLEGAAGTDQARLLQQIQALLGTGGAQQGLEQLGLDKTFEEFLRKYGHDFNVMNALAGILKSTPYGSTTTTSAPNNSGLGFLGSAAGAALSNPATMTMLATAI